MFCAPAEEQAIQVQTPRLRVRIKSFVIDFIIIEVVLGEGNVPSISSS